MLQIDTPNNKINLTENACQILEKCGDSRKFAPPQVIKTLMWSVMNKWTEDEAISPKEKEEKPSRWWMLYHFWAGICLKTYVDVSGLSKFIPLTAGQPQLLLQAMLEPLPYLQSEQ